MSDVVRERVRELQGRKGWSATKLAEQLISVGVPWNRSIAANFLSGRRPNVTLQELYALALVLDCSPIYLMTPPDNRPYRFVPGRADPADAVRAWIRGEEPLPGVDERTFHSMVSLTELRARLERLERGE